MNSVRLEKIIKQQQKREIVGRSWVGGRDIFELRCLLSSQVKVRANYHVTFSNTKEERIRIVIYHIPEHNNIHFYSIGLSYKLDKPYYICCNFTCKVRFILAFSLFIYLAFQFFDFQRIPSEWCSKNQLKIYVYDKISNIINTTDNLIHIRCRRSRDRMVLGFTITYAISAYNY